MDRVIAMSTTLKATIPVILLSFATVGLHGAAGPDLSKLPPASTQKELTYEKGIRPIL